MTENGDPYENAMAERINDILKPDFKLKRLFKSHVEAWVDTDAAIRNYNTLRLHISSDYLTPQAAHLLYQPLRKHWKRLPTGQNSWVNI